MNAFCKVAARAALSALLLQGAHAAAAPLDLNGRGIHHFASASGCPAGGDAAAQSDCNRIAIDLPDARATIDTEARTILFSGQPVGNDIVVGDVLLQGSGIAHDGRRVPLSLQVLVRRKGERWDMESYVHAPVEGNFSQVSIDPYALLVREGTQVRTLMTPERARDLFAQPSLRKRLARSVVSVRSSDGSDTARAGITVGLGFGKLSASVLQAAFKATGANGAAGVDEVFQGGDWEVALEALSNHIPRWVVQRELFLFGLEDQALLRGVRDDGLRTHDTLAFGARSGRGYLRFNGREAPFDGAARAGHAFMQESFMGLILAWRRDHGTPAP